jgi:hypothetical protein
MASSFEVNIEQEVEDWLAALDDERFGRHARRIDLLEHDGDRLDKAYFSVIAKRSREMPQAANLLKLTLYDDESGNLGISYFVGNDRRIFLLTVVQPGSATLAKEHARATAAWEAVAQREGYAQRPRLGTQQGFK